MKLNWGFYCIVLAFILFIIQAYIYSVPSLDTSFMPIRIGNQPLYRTHNYVEMAGFFVFGLGLSKILRTTTTPKVTKFLQIFGKIFALLLLLAMVAYAYLKSVELSSPFGDSFLAVILLIFPLPLGYYLYKIYRKMKSKG